MTSLPTFDSDSISSANGMIGIDPEGTEMAVPENMEKGLPRRFVYLIVFAVCMVVVDSVAATLLLTGEGETSHRLKLCVGLMNAMVGTLLSASGMCCQKWAHNQTKLIDTPATKQPVYWIGLLLLAIGTIAAVANLGILGQAVQSPFAALTLIYNAALAHTVLKETYTRYDLYSTLCIIAGVGLAVGGATMSNIQSTVYTFDDLLDLYFRESLFPPLYTITIIALVLTINTYVKSNEMESSSFGLFHFSVAAGLMAGFTSMAVKSSLEIVKGSVGNENDAWTWVGLCLFILAIPCALVPQLFYMNEGLKHFGTLKFVPLYQCFLILGNMCSGMVYFREMEEYTTLSKALFFTGCSITLIGVGILLAKEDPTDKATSFPLSASNNNGAANQYGSLSRHEDE